MIIVHMKVNKLEKDGSAFFLHLDMTRGFARIPVTAEQIKEFSLDDLVEVQVAVPVPVMAEEVMNATT